MQEMKLKLQTLFPKTARKIFVKKKNTLCLLEEGTSPTHLLRVVWVIHECVVAIHPVVEGPALPGASYFRNWNDANPVTLGSVACACVESGGNKIVRQHTFHFPRGKCTVPLSLLPA